MTIKRTNNKPKVFLDFDGTITKRDSVDAILEAFAGSKWLEVEKQRLTGRIGSRECLHAQTALVHCSRKQLNELLDAIEVDEGLASILEVCKQNNVAAHIVSDGFDYSIKRILARPRFSLARLLRSVRICASHLEHIPPSYWQASFPFFAQSCAHGCATCKPAVMRLLNPTDATTIFVGDGLSDKYAAERADLVFAKKSLANYCRAKNIAHVAYNDLRDVAAHLRELFPRADALARSGTGEVVGT